MKKIEKKLRLNKTNISSLNHQQLNQVRGGVEPIYFDTQWDYCITTAGDTIGGTGEASGNTIIATQNGTNCPTSPTGCLANTCIWQNCQPTKAATCPPTCVQC